MRLHVTHRTHFTYDEPAKDSFNEVRLQPTSGGGQCCDGFRLKVLPPASLSEYIDLYRNCVHRFEVSRLHRELTIVATAEVRTVDRPAVPPPGAPPVPLTALVQCAREEFCHDFLQSSAYVDATPELWRLALDVSSGLDDAWEISLAVMRHIYREFRYQPDATHVSTRASEVLRLRAGVCQDFAHLMVGLCRTLKIPARYVSGYLYNGPVDQLVGSQASHAWVEVFMPGTGWCALDPTNNQAVDGRYIKVAAGRDYSDVPPVRGTYRGSAARTMEVDVLVTALDTPTMATA